MNALRSILVQRRGMALPAAIALLAVFAMLGTAYVSYMWLEYSDAGVQLHRLRARHLAASGVYAAIGEIQAAFGDSRGPEAEYAFELSTYRTEQRGSGAYPQRVAVSVSDESGRVNLNSAPASLLRAMGLDTEAADKIVAMRGRNEQLASVDALRVNEILDAKEYDALTSEDFTVYTGGSNHATPAPLNLNTASPRVLAAAFAISDEEAKALAQLRPFANWSDAVQKTGREPVTFNLEVASFAPREKPAAIAFDSRCFRIRSEATLDMPGGDHRPVYAAVEAVVVIHDGGHYSIRLWRELRGADARSTVEQPPAETPNNETN
jgi:type II secretory pathway component PulK